MTFAMMENTFDENFIIIMNHTDQTSRNQSDHQINTGIIYLILPEPRLQLVKPQQSLDYKYQIEQDFSLRYRDFRDEEFHHTDADRYKISYENLYKNVLQSMFKTIDINEEITQIKHSIKYTQEILPIFIQNHKLAKREKKILYNIVTKTWQKFDECIQNEINVQYQLEQLKNEHQRLLKIKIQQEKYQKFYLEFHQLNNEITYLKREIQQLHEYKHQLETEVYEIKTHCSHNLIQFDYLQSTIIRHHINELNNLQLERDSIITQTELIKYNLFEHIQDYDHILRNYRQSLNNFRLTLNELEQQLKQQTDIELNHLQISNEFQRQTIYDDTEKLIEILQIKIEEKQTLNIQLQKTIDYFQGKIFKQKQLVIKKEKDYQTMDQIDQQLNYNISIYREIYLQLKNKRRTIERKLTTKLKEYTTDDRLNHTLIQQHDALLARKKLEQVRIHTSNEQLNSLIDENTRLKNTYEQLYNQYTKINPKYLFELREQIFHLKHIHQVCIQEKISNEDIKINSQNLDEKLQRKNNRISFRINEILLKFKQIDRDFQENNKHIQILENQLNEKQYLYSQENNFLKQMNNRSEFHRTKRNFLQTQIQIASNNIQHSQYRLKTFTEQLFMSDNDLVEQQISLKKLREFHSVLQEQDEISLKKFSTISIQLVHLRNELQTSQESLQQMNEDRMKYTNVRSILGRMLVRRVNLCQLLYKKLARIEKFIHQHEESIEMICQCINSLKIQIRQIRNETKKFLQRKDQLQLETVKAHINKILDHSHQKQQIFKRSSCLKRKSFCLNPLPTEESTYLKNKYYLLKTRLIKLIFRGIICNLVLLSIEQEFSNRLESYRSKSNRENSMNLNALRTNLYRLMRQLKAKTAENNMFIDYQYYFQFIQANTK